MKQKIDVLIAGAGPVGLVAANCLADAGMAVTVFEAEAELPLNLRASTFQPPTLDLLSTLGASAPLVKMGLLAPKIQYRDLNGWVVEFDFGLLAEATAHPFRLQCEQFRLNQILAERLTSHPHASIQFGSRVVGVKQDDESISITVEGPQGKRSATGQWLIGADGGRSQVRESLGIRLDGFTWPERFLVVSTAFDFAEAIPGLCNVSYFADPVEWFFLLRLPNLWRVMFPTKPEEGADDILSDKAIERRLRRIDGNAAHYPILHRTLYSVHQRVAETYRRGRAFLVGDAAHLNNPLGGMGLNGGIHDAFCLAEKLVCATRSSEAAGELECYERERLPVARDYINRISIANKQKLESRDPEEQRSWREEMTRISSDANLSRAYLLQASMIASVRKKR